MNRPKTVGVAIRMFLADGTPQGLRLVERLGWTGLCLAFARADYQSVRTRDEMSRTGAYILIGPDPDGVRTVRAYVGEADTVRSRLDQHFREKDFWTETFVLTTTDNSLNKAQVRYLEARLLELARDADVSALDNGTAPPLPRLSEPDVAVMESYLDYALTLLPLLGVNIFDVLDEVAESPTDSPAVSAPSSRSITAPAPDRPLLYLKTVLTEARGRDEARGFIVYEGATARQQKNVMLSTYEQLRGRLIDEGALKALNTEQYVLTKNVIFDSPSAAASVLSGGSKNGRTDWRTESGITLKQLQTQAVSTADGNMDELAD